MKRHRAQLAAMTLAFLSASSPMANAEPAPLDSAFSIAQLEKHLEGLVGLERELRAELESLDPKEAQVRKRLTARGRILYRLTRAGLLPVGNGFDALVAHAAKVEKIRRAVEQDSAELSRLSTRRSTIGRELAELALRRGPLEVEQQALSRARQALEEASDRQRAFERAFQSSSGPSDYVAVYGGEIASAEPLPSSVDGFRAMRGRLPFPLRGRAEIRAVRRKGASGPGLEMRAPTGTPVYALHAARVSYADTYDPFGKVIILDHGQHYYTLLGNIGMVDVRVGDEVPAGARIGTVGSDGTGGVLYVEIRRNTETLDPSPWFGL